MYWNGRTAIEGLSGSVSEEFWEALKGSATDLPMDLGSSCCTVPINRRPLRGSVLISRCCPPWSSTDALAALMHVATAESDMLRLCQTALISSSLLTTR